MKPKLDFTPAISSMWKIGDLALCIRLWPPGFPPHGDLVIYNSVVKLGNTYKVRYISQCGCSTRLEFENLNVVPPPEGTRWVCVKCHGEIGNHRNYVSTCFIKLDPERQAREDDAKHYLERGKALHEFIRSGFIDPTDWNKITEDFKRSVERVDQKWPRKI